MFSFLTVLVVCLLSAILRFGLVFVFRKLPAFQEMAVNGSGLRRVAAEILGQAFRFSLLVFCGLLVGDFVGGILWILASFVFDSIGLSPRGDDFFLFGNWFVPPGMAFGGLCGVGIWVVEVLYAVKRPSLLTGESPTSTTFPKYFFLVELPTSLLDLPQFVDFLIRQDFSNITQSLESLAFSTSVKVASALGTSKLDVQVRMMLPLGLRTKVIVEYVHNFGDQGELWEFAHELKGLLSQDSSSEQQFASSSHDVENGIKAEA
ncbi:MAG: hypothetical protein ACFCD0_13075 [Gemmataceae bacterium]